ncbi:MAG TPA: hypothetical protein VL588_06795, partial [Bdellovibrionota bacterium]|nr:hypothetical protein [Bdellovibrionota bacterium]
MGYLRAYGPGAAVAVLASLSLTACFGLGKRDDAKDAVLTGAFASELITPSSLARTSGAGTRMRLKILFPSSTAVDTLNPDDFHSARSSGLNRALGALDRPYNTVAIMALRRKVASLCDTEVGQGDHSNLFNLSGNVTVDLDGDPSTHGDIVSVGPALLFDETAPADPATAASLAAARRAWLTPYAPGSYEVQQLKATYDEVFAIAGDDREAKRAVCMAALLSPQFWIGNPDESDPAVRAAVEIGNRVPTMEELRQLHDKTLTLRAFVSRLQTEDGYHRSLHLWHEEWLGLRPFVN